MTDAGFLDLAAGLAFGLACRCALYAMRPWRVLPRARAMVSLGRRITTRLRCRRARPIDKLLERRLDLLEVRFAEVAAEVAATWARLGTVSVAELAAMRARFWADWARVDARLATPSRDAHEPELADPAEVERLGMYWPWRGVSVQELAAWRARNEPPRE